jgi:hypothetical protein
MVRGGSPAAASLLAATHAIEIGALLEQADGRPETRLDGVLACLAE